MPADPPRHHRLAGAGRADHQRVVPARRGDLERAPRQRLPVHVGEVAVAARAGVRSGARRRASGAARNAAGSFSAATASASDRTAIQLAAPRPPRLPRGWLRAAAAR